MMDRMKNNKLSVLLNSGKKDLLNIYVTAGFPSLNDTKNIIFSCMKSGVDLMEIGIPFSDPLADGPIIQQSSQQGIHNGMNVKLLFDELEALKSEIQIPLLLMGYYNSVLHFGVEHFCKRCKQAGISGLIIPDLPLAEYQKDVKNYFTENNLHNILLISPQTFDQRIREIDEASTAFIYAVSTSSTTGSKAGINDAVDFLKRIENMKLKHPVLTGFNINNRDSYLQACKYTRGAIIGSAYIKALSAPGKLEENSHSFIKSILNDDYSIK